MGGETSGIGAYRIDKITGSMTYFYGLREIQTKKME
jgi:hypothetical protein